LTTGFVKERSRLTIFPTFGRKNRIMLTCQKHLFSLPDSVTYLNCAYMSPQLKAVEAAGHQALSLKSQPFLIQAADFFEQVKETKSLFADLIDLNQPERLAILPSASYGISTVARNIPLRPGEKIIVTGEQFPSNYYPWKKLAEENGGLLEVVQAPSISHRSQAWNEAILKAITAETKVVALGHVHWTDGTLFDLKLIRQKTREVGALLVIDGTQSVGALPFSVRELQPDALICAAYKYLMGPYSIGLGYFGSFFDQGEPLDENWINRLNSQDFRGLVNYEEAYQPMAGRYSVGEHSNFLLIPMMLAGIKQLLGWQTAKVQAYCKYISKTAVERLIDMGAQAESSEKRCGHLFGVRLNNNFNEQKLATAFLEKEVYVSQRGDAIRIGPNVYNEPKDLAKLVDCFEQARIGKHRSF
jgi:selenocysteine lyase/cysteine desulfurase